MSPFGVKHHHGVRCGEMIWVGGQVDLNDSGGIQHWGNLPRQIAAAMNGLSRVLAELSATPEDLVKLLCFYVSDGTVDERSILDSVGMLLPEATRVAITVIPVPYLAYPGLLVEIEGYAMRGKDGRVLTRNCLPTTSLPSLSHRFVQAVRCGKMIFVSGQSPMDSQGRVHQPGDIVAQTITVMEQIGTALEHFGASLDDTVKLNRWYVGHGTAADWEPAALACAAHFREPGPAATGMPIPILANRGQQIKIEVVAMLSEDGRRLPRRHSWPEPLWDWPVHLPYKHGLKCSDMIFLGGQVSLDKKGSPVSPGNLLAQAHVALTHIGTILRDLGADYRDVCKLTTMYEGACSSKTLQSVFSICSSFFPDNEPPSTAIALPRLSYPEMVIEIDTFAMTETDPESGDSERIGAAE